jgi:glycosyltransferase involved in cell wall biosynthesis
MKDATILLFTNSYPYSGAAEKTFIENELIVLKERYKRVILVPISCSGTLEPFLPSLELDTSFSNFLEKQEAKRGLRILGFLQFIINPLLYIEILNRPDVCKKKKLIHFLSWWLLRALYTKKWLKQKYAPYSLENKETIILYTYWCSPVSLGIGIFSKNNNHFFAISRVLGSDLYEEMHDDNYLPFRKITLKLINHLFVVSNIGKEYLLQKYPEYAHKYTTSRLGVPDPHFFAEYSTDGKIRVVSCSYLVPVKRIDVLIAGLRRLAIIKQDWEILWTHIGGGPLMDELEILISQKAPSNLKFIFTGYIPSVYDYYRSNPVDLIVNTSKSEGIPVTIMEANSCGIPAMATAVGGNPEIVSEKTGFLLPSNPNPDEIAQACITLFSNPDILLQKRRAAWRNWHENYNSSINFNNFLSQINSMIKQK